MEIFERGDVSDPQIPVCVVRSETLVPVIDLD